MSKVPKVRKGIMMCEGQRCESHDHGAPVVVFENERGTLSYSCDWCGRSPYARPGTGQHAEWLDELTRRASAAAPVPAAVVQPVAQEVNQAEEPVQKKAKQASGTFFG